MALISSFIQKYRDFNNGECPEFFWQLKLNDNDFEDLKNEILEESRNRFQSIEEDVALYYSEWWRRLYDGGTPSKEDVCLSLNLDEHLSIDLFQAARKGAKHLGIQIIRTQGNLQESTRYFDSLRYQGGLPMNYISKHAHDAGGWHNFFKGLAWKGQDYSLLSEADGRKTIPLSKSIRRFCDSLQFAADQNRPDFLPFHINMDWWKVIKRDIDTGIKERNEHVPFRLFWVFQMDDREKSFHVEFRVTGPRTLPETFCTENELDEYPNTSVAISINGNSYPLAEYDKRFYCRRAVDAIFKYQIGDVITLRLNEKVLWQKWLDFSVPKLLSLNDAGTNTFALCDSSELLRKGCRVICLGNWMCKVCPTESYNYDQEKFSVFSFNPSTESVLLVSEDDGREEVIRHDSPRFRTEIVSSCAIKTDVPVLEQIFDAPDNVQFVDYPGGSSPTAILYADKYCRSWKRKPSYGDIRARFDHGSESSDAVKFINVGHLDIKTITSSIDNCKLRITWPHGVVRSPEACEDNGVWDVQRVNLTDKRYVIFDFIPRDGETFKLHFIPPFNDFCIFDKNGHSLKNNAIIPIVDIDSYRFYLNLNETMEMYPDRIGADLKYTYLTHAEDGKRCNSVSRSYFNDPPIKTEIPLAGSLSALFQNGSGQIFSQLEQAVTSLTKAEAVVSVQWGGSSRTYTFKEYPYVLEYRDGVISLPRSNRLPEYDGSLLAIPLYDPLYSPIKILESDTPGQFLVPDEMKNIGVDKWLVYGDRRGYILPRMIDVSVPGMGIDDRMSLRESTLSAISAELKEARCFDPIWERAMAWFNLLPKGQIPGSSILELVAISEDRDLLAKFVVQLALSSADDDDKLEALRLSLFDFQRQMSVLWVWSADIDFMDFLACGNQAQLMNMMRIYYNKWVISSKTDAETLLDYLQNIDTHFIECLEKFVKVFKVWYEIYLKGECLPQEILLHPDTNAYRNTDFEGVSSPEAQEAFRSFRQGLGHLLGDERWIEERRAFSNLLQRKNLSDYLNECGINHNEHIRREIRKSIMFGLKFRYDYEV